MSEGNEFKYTIEIVLNSEGSSGNGNGDNPSNPSSPKNNPGTSNDSAKELLKKFAPAVVAGKNMINFATSNIGTFTGNAKLQDQVNFGLKTIGYGAMIAVNPAMGLVALGTDIATSAISYNFNQKWKDREIEQARYKAGYSAVNRSR